MLGAGIAYGRISWDETAIVKIYLINIKTAYQSTISCFFLSVS